MSHRVARPLPQHYAVLPDGSAFGTTIPLPPQMSAMPLVFAGQQPMFRGTPVVRRVAEGYVTGESKPVTTFVPQAAFLQYHKRGPGDGATRGHHLAPTYGVDAFLTAQQNQVPEGVLAETTAPAGFSFVETMRAMADRMGLTSPSAPPLPPPPSLVRLRPTDMRNAGPVTSAQIVERSGAMRPGNPRSSDADRVLSIIRTAEYRQDQGSR